MNYIPSTPNNQFDLEFLAALLTIFISGFIIFQVAMPYVAKAML